MSLNGRDDDARDAEAEVLLEVAVFGGDDGLTQHRRHVVVADDDAALDCELADDAPVARQQTRDGVRLVAVEGGDFGDVAGVGEEHTADGSQEGGDDKERDQTGIARPRAAPACSSVSARLRLSA